MNTIQSFHVVHQTEIIEYRYYSSIERNTAVPENSPGQASCSPARSYTGGGLGGGAVMSVLLESQRTKPNSLKTGVHIGLSE